jgi:hypothetical protein
MGQRSNFSLMRGMTAALAALTMFGAGRAAAYDIVNRWSHTQLDGNNLQRGDAVTLRWSIVPDGQSYSRSNNSQLVQFLDDGWNVPAGQRVPSFSGRPWWGVINQAYQQFGRVSGVTMMYVPEQNGAGVDTGFEGDIRIGGENLDGTPGGALADNTFPDDGDMRIDITREADGSVGAYFNTEPGLRNLVIHESGHGVGLGHAQFVNNSAKAVMEGGLRTDIWGLQFDDVYALKRQYGDPKERNGGNNTHTTATMLGSVTTTGSISVGRDAVDSVVEQFDDDWLGIDGTSDSDWFRFTIAGPSVADITLTPVGPTYETVQQGVFNAAAMNDLEFQVFQAPSMSLIGRAAETGIGLAESIADQLFPTAGEYFIRVLGRQDANQFYQLDLSFSELPVIDENADFDGDADVDGEDFLVWQRGVGTGSTLSQGDANEDLQVDGLDLQIWKDRFGEPVLPDSNASAVPEPNPLLLASALFGLVASELRLKRRCG